MTAILSVRELQQSDIDLIADYWLTADKAFLEGMGVDTMKMPAREEWTAMLNEQLQAPMEEKKSYCMIWQVDGQPVGHSNVNKIVFGEEAYMHLHIWNAVTRRKGFGTTFIKMTIPFFFKNLKLKQLYCEPYALNPSPNRTLAGIGFELVKEYVTVPGWLNFEQPVKLWRMSDEQFNKTLL